MKTLTQHINEKLIIGKKTKQNFTSINSIIDMQLNKHINKHKSSFSENIKDAEDAVNVFGEWMWDEKRRFYDCQKDALNKICSYISPYEGRFDKIYFLSGSADIKESDFIEKIEIKGKDDDGDDYESTIYILITDKYVLLRLCSPWSSACDEVITLT